MNKNLLISALLLAAVGCSATPSEMEEVRAEALTSRSNLIEKVFVSKDAFEYTTYDYHPETHTSVPRKVMVKLRAKFIVAADYTLNDEPSGLDYEVVFEKFVEETGETFYSDMHYFARKTGDIKYQLFDCDSTSRCSTDSQTSRFYVFDTPEGKGMRIKNEGVYLIDTHQAEIELYLVR